MILHPDFLGNTAIDIAIDADRPFCVELMVDMLEDYKTICLSKMMLNIFPYMIM